MFKKINLSGQRFGKLLVVSKSSNKKNNHILWNCVCDCGNEVEVTSSNIGKSTNSCGCLKNVGNNHTHMKSKTKLYKVWLSMKARCNNKNATHYEYYGGKGISVCKDWNDSFEAFLLDMGEPERGMTLDRIDVDGNYCKENCRWASREMQARNRTNNKFIEFNGESMCLKDWAKKIGIRNSSMQYRIKNWPLEKALTTGV